MIGEPLNRVDGRRKVTGAATYAAEYDLPGLVHAVLVGSTVAKGRIADLDTKAAEGAPGVLAVLTHRNAPKVPGFVSGEAKGPTEGQQLRVFFDDQILFSDQPIAVVVADTLERARYAARLVRATYAAAAHQTNFGVARPTATLPKQAQKNPKAAQADYDRGQADAYKAAPVQVEAEYEHPSDMHQPMELQALVAHWEAPDRLTVYDKTQAVVRMQQAYAKEWAIPEANVKVVSTFVGGAFGNGLRNWPHQTAAIMAAKHVGRPVKLMLAREQMMTLVGYRPHTWQRLGVGATPDGRLTGVYHEAVGQTSTYEEFTEHTLQQTRILYACPNVATRYRLAAVDLSTPTPMRGPGEATGAFALESALDELAYKLKLDPIELRRRNFAPVEPEKNRPWSTNFLLDCYRMGAERIGWQNRAAEPGTHREGDWRIGYGMAVGMFSAGRRNATIRATRRADGTVLIRSAVTDIGPGTGTAMTQIAADTLNLPPDKITFEWGSTEFPPAPAQGGSSTVNTVGAAVRDACVALRKKLTDAPAGTEVGVELESKPNEGGPDLAKFSFVAHFAHVRVHVLTGEVRVQHMVACADAGTIINQKTAASQMIGGAIGGIGMALTEDAVVDHRPGRYVTRDFAGYHVPVHADAPPVDVVFVNKPDYQINELGTKGIGEIATIGVAGAIANAVFNATGVRVRSLPITPDKLL